MNRRPILSTGLHVAKSMLAVVLVFATVASTAPPSAVLAASHSTMDCCAGMGGAMGSSCPLHHSKQSQQLKPAQSDPMCDMDGKASAHGEMMHEHHTPQGHTADAMHGEARVEHSSGQHVSPQNTPAEAANSLAVVSKPCASDCCKRANSLTQTQRTRDEAAFSDKLRQRPPTSGVGLEVSHAVSNYISKARRQCPPRGPPSSLSSLSA